MSAGDAAGTADPAVTGAEDPAGALTVRVGDPIPSIGLRASDGYLLNLRSFVTRQPAVFLFFAAPTAKGEQRRRGTQVAESLAVAREQLAAAAATVVGVTCDNERQQAAWIEEERFPYLLFSDERRSAVQNLGIPVSRDGDNMNVERPVVLVVGRDGLLKAAFRDPDPTYVADIVLAAVRRAEGLDPEPSAPAEPSS